MLHRRKLLALVTLAGAGCILLLSYGVDAWFRGFLIQSRIDALHSEARLLASIVRSDIPNLEAFLNRSVLSLPRQITILDEYGTVVAASPVDRTEWDRVTHPASLPEFEEAARNGLGTQIRFSSVLQEERLYVAVALTEGGGFLRLSTSLREVDGTISSMTKQVTGAGLLILGVGAIGGWFVVRRFSTASKQLQKEAEKMASGHVIDWIPIRSGELLGPAARALESASRNVWQKVQRLEEECTHLSTILASMSEGVMVTDFKGRIVETNPAFLRIFNLFRNPIGKLPLEVVRSVEIQNCIGRVVEQGREQEVEMGFNERVLRARFAPIRVQGKISGVVIAFYDITELRRLERIRKEFVSNVSHELRTPLTSIQGFAETLLDEEELDPQHRKFADKIVRNARQLSAMIAELLELARIESGEIPRKVVPIRFESLMQQLATDFEKRLQEKGIQFSYENRSGQDFFEAGEVYIRRILDNLLDNALKYTPAGSVRVEMSRVDGEILFCVRDTGIGIPPEDLERIFERFYRVNKDRSRASGGSGIGLAIVKHLIQLHKGRVWAESRPGKGTAIYFTLPA